MMAQHRCGWAQGWSASHSRSYGLREDQADACLGKPAPQEAASDAQVVADPVRTNLVELRLNSSNCRSAAAVLLQYRG